ncbi:hypothetical protein C7B61_16695, partial [filamentous cyanobacterium CCP1]
RTSPVPMAIATLEGRMLEVNDSLLKFFGYARVEMVGRTALELNLWCSLDQRQHYRALLQRQRSVRNLEAQLRTKSGEIKTVLLSAEIRTLEGQDCLIVAHRDITERVRLEADRKQAIAQLRQTEKWLHQHSRLSPSSIYTLVQEPDGRIWFEYVSSAVEVIHEITVEQTLQNASLILDAMHPDDRGGYQAAVAKNLLTLAPFSYQWRIITPSGVVKWLQGNSQPERRENGAVAWHGVVMDITDRKAVEIALQRYERIVSATSDAISLVDRQYCYQLVNQTYLDWNQKSYSEIVGHSVSNLMGQEAFETVIRPYLDRCLAGEIIQYSEWFEFPGRGRQFLNVTYSPYLEVDQTISGVVVSVRNITPLKQAELALRESEERFRQIAENINQLFFVRSAETGQFLYISPAYEKIWGRTCESLYQNPDSWLESLYPDDRLFVLNSIQTQTQGSPIHREYRIVRPNGEVRWIAAEISLIVDEIGQPLRYTGFAEDITDRKQTEQALQEREAMLRAIGDNLPKGFIYQRVYEPDKGFYYSYISAGIERLLGLKPEAILKNPKAIREVGFAEDLAHADLIIQESLMHFTPIELQMRNRTINGDIQWSSIRSTPRRLADGRIVWDGIEVDITDLKRAEAALRASEEQFRRAFDDAPTGVSLVRITGQFVKVNARYCDLLGYTEAELLLMTFQEITHPADLDKDLEGLQRMLTGEIDSFQVEKRYITKHGAIVPVLMHAALIYDPDGQPLYSVGHVQDIRDRLKVERMKEEFISVVSHELRTPLTSIRGALGILGSGVFDDRPEKAKHMLQIATNNSDRLVNLVNNILNLERLKSGKVQLVREQCQVADLMHQAIDSVQPIADQAEITLSCIPLFTTLWAAPDAIIQTLINLLSNAIKFSSAGGTVWLKAEMKGEWGVG